MENKACEFNATVTSRKESEITPEKAFSFIKYVFETGMLNMPRGEQGITEFDGMAIDFRYSDSGDKWKDHEVISAMAMFAGHMMIESMFDDRIRKLCTNAYYRLKEQFKDAEDISKATDIKIAMEGKLGALITSDACKFLPTVKLAAKHYKDRKDGKA